LDRRSLDKVLADFNARNKPPALEAAWVNAWSLVAQVEAALRQGIRPKTTDEGIAPEDQLMGFVGRLIAQLEDMIAKRYVGLERGVVLRLPSAAIGRVVGLRGLRLAVFVPADAWISPDHALKRFDVPRARLPRIDADQDPSIGIPGYYWLLRAYERYDYALDLLRICKRGDWDLYELVGTLEEACSAAFSAWLSVSPSDEAMAMLVEDPSTRGIDRLPGAPPEIAQPLIRCATTANRLLIEGGNYLLDQSSAWYCEAGDVSAEVGSALDAMAVIIEPMIDLTEGDTVMIEDLGHGCVRERQGLNLVIALEGARNIEIQLLERFIERTSRG
jgi:hypothetical protein